MNEQLLPPPLSTLVIFLDYQAQHFVFDIGSATTMTTTIKTTMMLLPTSPLPHVAQKGSF
jgi:hypothetical protein